LLLLKFQRFVFLSVRLQGIRPIKPLPPEVLSFLPYTHSQPLPPSDKLIILLPKYSLTPLVDIIRCLNLKATTTSRLQTKKV